MFPLFFDSSDRGLFGNLDFRFAFFSFLEASVFVDCLHFLLPRIRS